MGIMGRIFSFLGKRLRKKIIGRTIYFSSCEGPYSEILNTTVGKVNGLLNLSENVVSKNVLLVELRSACYINSKEFKYIAVVPRYVGYDIHALTIIPIAANLIVLETENAKIEQKNVVAIGVVKLGKA